jgi:ribosomal protein S5
MNIVKGVFNGFENLMQAPVIAAGRGKTIKDMWG